jgi:hypothetical protein
MAATTVVSSSSTLDCVYEFKTSMWAQFYHRSSLTNPSQPFKAQRYLQV